MSSISSADESTVRGSGPQPLGRIVDWIVALLLALSGLLAAAFGALLFELADRSLIADLVAEGTIESTLLTEAELIDTTYGLAWWGGIGLAVTGVLLLLSAVGFLVYRRRARSRREATGIEGPDTTTNAIVGAVATVVLSFVPFAPVLGGLVSGYLQGGDGRDGMRVGAYAGLVASLPMVVLFVFLAGGFVLVGTELGLGLSGVFVGLILLFALLVVVAYMVALSALGGYLGVSVGDRNRESAA